MFNKKEALYRPILKKALELTWRNKFLWVFGFFATFLGSGGVYDVIIKGWNTVGAKALIKNFANFTAPPFTIFEGTGTTLVNSLGTPGLVAGTTLGIILIVGLYVLAIASQGGAVYSAGALSKGKKVNLRKGFDKTISKFFHILGLNLGAKIIIFLLLLLVGLPVVLLAGQNTAWSNVFYFLAFLVSIPLSLVVLFVMLYAVAGIMVKKLPLWIAIKDGLQILKKHWLISLEMALILLGLSVGLGLVVSIALLILSVPFLVLGIALNFLVGEVGLTVIITLALIIFLFTVIVLGSAFTAFQLTSWTILYMKLSDKGAISAIVRTLKGIPEQLKKLKK
ncbi:MAG: hypothetical protein U9P90_04735 [Patescibacteria group bacterium]|nr:hypothetical protein [Patescibacteria group bacterium]